MADIKIHCSHDEMVDIVKLVEHPKNPNKHDSKQIDLLARVIAAQGWRNSITVSRKSGFIIAGHGRYLAAKQLKLKTVPVDYQGFETEADEMAHLLADNRIAELAELDTDFVAELIKELGDLDFNLDLTGFDVDAINKMLGNLEEEPTVDSVEEKFEVVVECDNERHQRLTYEQLMKEKHRCRVLTF